MKGANLISILSGYHNLSEEVFESYLKYHSIQIKKDELDDLTILCNHIDAITKNVKLFDNFFIGYTIPQIGKEFDLLRIDKESIVNIEIKKETELEKVQTQLKRNQYYLSFLKQEAYLFSYVSSTQKLYSLDSDKKLIELNIRQLIEKIASQEVLNTSNINKYFNPSNYLVSPFNSTEQFMKGKYFLTTHQEDIKKSILKELTSSTYSILSIKGKAGTGKTLLTYDIAKEVYRTNEILIVHCGILNNGHFHLRDNYGWNIVSAKNMGHQDLSKIHLIIVDESQRIRKHQLLHLVNEVKKYSINCIFSYDAVQTLRSEEIKANISIEIEKHLSLKPFELTTKIRTNKEVAQFIKCLFDCNEIIRPMDYSNIELNYFNNYSSAKNYLEQLKSENWKVINYTPDSRRVLPYQNNNLDNESDNAHTVVGQEFDNVIATIDSYFYYKDGKLSTCNYTSKPYYHPTKMLFQIVSRTRIKLGVVIINNPEVLKRCLRILDKST